MRDSVYHAAFALAAAAGVWITTPAMGQQPAPKSPPGPPAGQPLPLPVQQPRPWVPPPRPWTPPPQPTPPAAFFPFWLLFLPVWLIILHQQQKEQERVREEQRAEEEDATPYTARDLMEEWEFKIVRCTHPSFVRPDFLAAFLEQESAAGWQLVEVFDGQRVRLKRPTSRRSADGGLPAGTEPYRLYITDPAADAARARSVARGLWIAAGVCGVVAVGLGVVALNTPATGAYIVTGMLGAVAALFAALAWRKGQRG